MFLATVSEIKPLAKAPAMHAAAAAAEEELHRQTRSRWFKTQKSVQRTSSAAELQEFWRTQ